MRNLYLIGMMGCGKSTIAKILASQTDKKNIDLDKEIEKSHGCSIPTIFKDKGEEYFRIAETAVLKQFSNRTDQIIACGGGVVLKPENVEIMKKDGIILYLNREPDNILKDIDVSKRPLLKSGAQNLNVIYEKRKPLYKDSADIIIENNGTLEDTAQKIIDSCPDFFEK